MRSFSTISGTRFLRRMSHHTPARSRMPTHSRSHVHSSTPRLRRGRSIDIDIANGQAFALDQRGKETMQAVEIRQSQEHIAAERLEAAAGVARAVAQHRRRAPHWRCATRLLNLPLRPRRWPATSPPCAGAPASSVRIIAGMKAGSFCPSPSIVTTIGAAPRVRTSAPLPTGRRTACGEPAQKRMQRHQPLQLGFGPSVEPSLT